MKYALILLVLTLIVALLSGCSAQIGASGELYWPEENNNNVWRSRAEFHRKTSVTRQNMGEYY